MAQAEPHSYLIHDLSPRQAKTGQLIQILRLVIHSFSLAGHRMISTEWSTLTDTELATMYMYIL